MVRRGQPQELMAALVGVVAREEVGDRLQHPMELGMAEGIPPQTQAVVEAVQAQSVETTAETLVVMVALVLHHLCREKVEPITLGAVVAVPDMPLVALVVVAAEGLALIAPILLGPPERMASEAVAGAAH